MRHLSSFVRVLAVSFTFLAAPAVFADAASVQEADALIKDDIANAVLISDADAYSAACETAKTRWEEEVAPLLVQ